MTAHRPPENRVGAEEGIRSGPVDLFRAVFETSGTPSFVFDERTLGMLVVNDAALAFYGYSRAEFMELRVPSLLDEAHWRLARKAMSAGEAREVDNVHRRADGSVAEVRVNAYRLRFPSGVYWNVQVRDRSELLDGMRVSMDAAVTAVKRAVAARDPYTENHQHRVAHLCSSLAVALELSEDMTRGLRTAAELHDVGKIGLPAEILNFPGHLSAPAIELVRTHPQVGHDMIETIPFPWPVARIVLEHHERLDGSGYPFGLRRDEILVESRVLAVADVVEAMTSHRPYRPALSLDTALEELRSGGGRRYDIDVVRACDALLKSGSFEFPGLALG